MRVVFYSAGDELAEWQQAFSKYLPSIVLEEWTTAAPGADYAIAWKPPAELFTQQSTLKAMFALGAGVDALLPHVPDSLPLYRLEDSGMAEQMADYVTRMVLDWFYHNETYRQQQTNAIWQPHALLNKQDWPIAVLGVGELGQVVAKRCQQLGFPVTGWRQQDKPVDGLSVVYGDAGLSTLLASSKIVVNLLPLTPQTNNLINASFLSQLPPASFLINIARGAQVVDEDLVSALASGQLAGAALDVFRDEPLHPQHPFWHHPKIRVTPHIAGITPMDAAAAQIANKLQQVLKGEIASGLVNRQIGY